MSCCRLKKLFAFRGILIESVSPQKMAPASQAPSDFYVFLVARWTQARDSSPRRLTQIQSSSASYEITQGGCRREESIQTWKWLPVFAKLEKEGHTSGGVDRITVTDKMATSLSLPV